MTADENISPVDEGRLPILFQELVPDPQLIAGIKATWGPITSRVLCFGTRGVRESPKGYFSVARQAAEVSIERPFVIAIGGGHRVTSAVDGRAIEIVRISGVYGETQAFVRDPAELELLHQWPVAVAASDVFTIERHPHLVDDLKFPDLGILAYAFDKVVRPEAGIVQLWKALHDHRLLVKDLPPIYHFRDPGKVVLASTFLPKQISAEEGKKLMRSVRLAERNSKIALAAKERNKEVNYGKLRCEACEFSHEKLSLFDAHHKVPLAFGKRITCLSDFAVLCPNRHRIAHRIADKDYDPLTVREIKEWRVNCNNEV